MEEMKLIYNNDAGTSFFWITEEEVLTNKAEIIEQQGKGRHDPCVVPRAVPIVEAMAALVIADYFLLNKIYS